MTGIVALLVVAVAVATYYVARALRLRPVSPLTARLRVDVIVTVGIAGLGAALGIAAIAIR